MWWQVWGLAGLCRAVPAVTGFAGAPRLSPLIQKGLNGGVCRDCNPALRMQKKFEMTLEKLFPSGGGQARLPALLVPGHSCQESIGKQPGMSQGGFLALLGFGGPLGAGGPTRGPLPTAF